MNHLYEISTGRLHSSTAAEITDIPDGMAVKTLPDGDEVGVWNTATLSFDPRPARKRFSKLEFMDRFTDTELTGILAAAKVDTVVELFVKKLDAVQTYVDCSDPRTVAAVNALEAGGLIGAGRAEVILNG